MTVQESERPIPAEAVRINGIDHVPSGEEIDMTLIDYLREALDLTGTKRGCDIGACGSCTVVVDGMAKRSCTTKLKAVLGKAVITIEGIASPESGLHPIQQAFIDSGAIQCGFCTPGMVMTSYAFLARNRRPDREAIRKALSGNLCRCTGYQQIVDAIELASRRLYPENAE
jgi:carbon-monoxide dehydrogenase small subunit